MAQTRFFNNTTTVPDKEKWVREYSFINVGGEQFRAVAVALIDQLKNSTRFNERAVKKILERFFIHFPDYKSSQAYLTSLERMTLLINNSRRSEVIKCMAYVLRQLTVDELLTNPLMYRDVFEGLSAELPKDSLRHSSIILSASSLAALAHVLGLTVILSFKEPGKELRRREVYGENLTPAPKFEITLQVQGHNYFPGVKNKFDFISSGNPPAPVEYNSSLETLADIMHMIAVDNKRLLHSYEQSRRQLLSMVDAGELNKNTLVDFYINFLPLDSHLNNGLESVAFFSRLEGMEKKVVISEPIETTDQHIINLLVESLAGWISTRQIDVNQLFDSIENKPMHRSSPAA